MAEPAVDIRLQSCKRTGSTFVDGLRQAPNGQEFDRMFIASTENLATDGGVIRASAWRTEIFDNNPVFISSHNASLWDVPITEVSIGTVVWTGVRTDLSRDLSVTGNGFMAAVRFASTPFAQEVKTLYEEGALNAVSVRWDPRTHQLREPTDVERSLYGPEIEWVAERADLLELSAVILPADPGAVTLRSTLRAMRDRGEPLEHVESFIEKIGERQIDESALQSAVADMRSAVVIMEQWLNQGEIVRDTIADALTGVESIMNADSPLDAMNAENEEEERALETNLLGKRLPLNQDDVDMIAAAVTAALENSSIAKISEAAEAMNAFLEFATVEYSEEEFEDDEDKVVVELELEDDVEEEVEEEVVAAAAKEMEEVDSEDFAEAGDTEEVIVEEISSEQEEEIDVEVDLEAIFNSEITV